MRSLETSFLPGAILKGRERSVVSARMRDGGVSETEIGMEVVWETCSMDLKYWVKCELGVRGLGGRKG